MAGGQDGDQADHLELRRNQPTSERHGQKFPDLDPTPGSRRATGSGRITAVRLANPSAVANGSADGACFVRPTWLSAPGQPRQSGSGYRGSLRISAKPPTS